MLIYIKCLISRFLQRYRLPLGLCYGLYAEFSLFISSAGRRIQIFHLTENSNTSVLKHHHLSKSGISSFTKGLPVLASKSLESTKSKSTYSWRVMCMIWSLLLIHCFNHFHAAAKKEFLIYCWTFITTAHNLTLSCFICICKWTVIKSAQITAVEWKV